MAEERSKHFIEQIIEDDVAAGRHTMVRTRFPPEPNGYLHVGHAKAILLNHGMANQYGGQFHLRMDDTNPAKEDMEYVRAIQHDIAWLGCDWGENFFHAADYFERYYEIAEHLIKTGKAYICAQTLQEMRRDRGTVTEPGVDSPWRDRPIEENLDLFRRMRAGEFGDGELTLRGKMDMASPNMKLRDAPLYRIRHQTHHRTGDTWCIYPMYDYAHCLGDAIEGITHSLCSLEFDNNRALYDWVLDHSGVPWDPRPRQYEFGRMALTNTVMSKRRLLRLVEEGHVSGWDDPRMPTIAGMRRRGFTASGIRAFIDRVAVAKQNAVVDVGLLEFSIRDDLNPVVPRVMAVIDPLEIVIDNWPVGEVDELDAPLYPHDVPKKGSRTVPFSGRLYIERADFMADPPKKFFRLAPGREVRLRYGYLVTCVSVQTDAEGVPVRVHCTYDPQSRGGKPADGRKVKGTLHWVSAEHALPAEFRLIDRLFNAAAPDAEEDFIAHLNPDSLDVRSGFVEPSIGADAGGTRYQFERQGYYIADSGDSGPGHLVYNRIVSLKDTWAKVSQGASRAPKKAAKAVSSGPAKVVERTPEQVAAIGRLVDLGVASGLADVVGAEPKLVAFFDRALKVYDGPASVAKLVANEVLKGRKGRTLAELPYGPAEVASLARLIDEGVVSGRAAKDVFEKLNEEGGDPVGWVETLGLRKIGSADDLIPVIDDVLENNPDNVARFADNPRLLGFFVGQVMKATRGKADPKLVNQLLQERLG